MRSVTNLINQRRVASGALALVACFLVAARSVVAQTPAKSQPPIYTFATEHNPDGIGKFYQGREIAQVMGHEGSDWLERPERQSEERPDLLMAALKLHPGDTAADIGAGTGYFTWRMANIVGDSGRIYANDIQPEMLELLSKNMALHRPTNFQTALGTLTDANLPSARVDLVLMVDVYHEFDHPYEMMQSICRALKPGGRVVWVEYRAEDPSVPIKPLHKMSVAQVRKEAAALPLRWIETIETLPRQHIIIFQKQTQ